MLMSYVRADNIICSVGHNTSEVISAIEAGKTGIAGTKYASFTKAPVALINRKKLQAQYPQVDDNKYTFFEQLAICSVSEAIDQANIRLDSPDTLLVVSTTKGNIELLEKDTRPGDGLVASAANNIATFFNAVNPPLVVCNACISGVLALSVADRYIKSGKYQYVVVVGADVAIDFVVAGFESFKSMSEIPCKPFDKKRAGLSLGEGAGTMVLSAIPKEGTNNIRITGSGSANDANHISGPSRTGEGAFLAARRALRSDDTPVDFISAHGTATPYNDDMESIAIKRLGLSKVPVNSFKGYFGHTLGAAGVIESILTIQSLKQNKLYKTLGLNEPGVKESLNHLLKNESKSITRALKMASGFGGCNASIVFEKYADE